MKAAGQLVVDAAHHHRVERAQRERSAGVVVEEQIEQGRSRRLGQAAEPAIVRIERRLDVVHVHVHVRVRVHVHVHVTFAFAFAFAFAFHDRRRRSPLHHPTDSPPTETAPRTARRRPGDSGRVDPHAVKPLEAARRIVEKV